VKTHPLAITKTATAEHPKIHRENILYYQVLYLRRMRMPGKLKRKIQENY